MSDASWWAALRHGGLLLSPAQVARLDAAPLAPFPSATAEKLRRAIVRASADDLPASARTAAQSDLLTLLLEDVAGLKDAARSAPRPASAPAAPAGHWLRGAEVDASLSVRSVTGEAIRPRRLWLGGNGARLPVFFSDEARLGVGRGKRAPARLLEWLRVRSERLALLASPTQLRLAYAGADHDAFCEWDLALFFPEGEPGPQVEALRRLLSPQLLVPPKPGEPAPFLRLVLDARKGQADLSSTLGERVRRAVELLVASHAPALAALEERGRALPHEAVYRAAVRVVMRLVVLLFAEARPDLLPRENPVFHGSYSLAGLRESLERQGSGGGRERLRQQAEGWPRVLALFRLLHAGSHHEALPVPRYGGRLFEPGDAASPDPQSRAVALLESAVFDPALHGVMTDADVALLLDLLTRTKATMRQGTRTVTTTLPVDFESLSTEFIGILYEGLLDYELRRAAPGDPVLFLDLGDQPALPLSRLTALSDAALAGLVEKLKAKAKPEGEEDDGPEEDGAGDGEEAAEAETEAAEATPAGEDAPLAVEAGAPPDAEPGGDGAVAEADDAHVAAWDAALAWARRAVVAGGLAPKPRGRKPEALAAHAAKVEGAARGLLREVVVPGGYYLVRWGGTRKGAGTFYTRPQLAGPTARRTLQPLLYADDGAPRRPEEILALRVCDPAMGSGSFLVSALRLLVKALYASLHHHGRVAPHGAGSRVVVTLPEGMPATGRLVEELLPCLPDDPDFEARLLARLKRHVVERCLYGVDLDPLAVELAQLSLWIETLDRSLPFEFLDHKLKAGNSLVGAWFDRYRDYPLLAWEREGGDEKHDGVHHLKSVAPAGGRAAGKEKTTGNVWGAAIREAYARAKADLGDLLDGQQGLFEQATGPDPAALHDEAVAAFEALHALPPHDPDGVAELYRERVLGSPSLAALREAFDAWCALWFWPADRLDLAPLPSTFDRLAPEARAVVAEVAARERFFHWELEFPDVFARPGSGFDAILGNPPWEIQKPSSKEFFSNLDPLYRAYGKQEALKRQREIFEANAADEEAWLAYVARFKALSGFTANAAAPFGDPAQGEGVSLHRSPSRSAERHGEWRSRRGKVKGYADREHPFRHQGSADVNTYKLFLEEAHALLRPGGRLGFLVPSGLYTDKGSIALRRLFLERCRWTHLYAFQNERFVFEAIHHSFKVISLCVEKGGSTEAVLTRFRLGPGDSPEVTELETDIPADERYLSVRADQIARLSPRSLAVLEIRHPRDLEVLEKIYAGSVLLGDDSEEGWGIKYAREFDMTNDSHLFAPRPEWEAKGYRPDEYGRWVGPEGEVALPLYEGRMVDFFDPAQKAWVSGSARQALWAEISWAEKRPAAQSLMAASTYRDSAGAVPPDDCGAKVGFLDVTAATNERTMVSAVLPPWPCGNTVPLLRTPRSAFGLSAVLNSYAFDLVMRNRCGGVHLNYFVIEDAPLPRPAAIPKFVSDLSLRLGSSTSFMASAWRSLSTNHGRAWRSLWAITDHERLRLRALLDAVVAEALRPRLGRPRVDPPRLRPPGGAPAREGVLPDARPEGLLARRQGEGPRAAAHRPLPRRLPRPEVLHRRARRRPREGDRRVLRRARRRRLDAPRDAPPRRPRPRPRRPRPRATARRLPPRRALPPVAARAVGRGELGRVRKACSEARRGGRGGQVLSVQYFPRRAAPMLQRVKIEGFKSLYSAEIELGTANVFIGANGSGKSNILEAVGVLGAAAFRSVEPEALRYRGVRPGLPALYKSSFERVSREAGATKPRIRRNIVFECTSDGALYRIGLDNPIASGLRPWNVLSETLEEGGKAFLTRSPRGCNVRASRPPQKLTPPKVETAVRVALQQLPETAEARRLVESLAGFCIFSPTTPVLRGLSDDVARIPLGLSGSGLAAAVKELLKAGEGQLGPFDLDEVWDLIEWADDVAAVSPQQASVSPAVSVGPSVLRFRDRFMKKGRNTLSAFDASEGALYVLFLLTLVAHEQAPRLFAVDNFDHALHPRLATRLTRMVVDQLLEDGSRQMLLTTHNPLLLDGLDLSDDRVRLFAVERSASGDTRVHRILLTPELAAEGEKGLSLSRLWVMGRLGAVPRGL